jgi:outer membrane biosynthesis protein TonB
MSFLDTRHKKKSFTLTTLLLSVLLLFLFYIGLTYMDPPEENGISVNFGTTDFGKGQVQPREKIRSEPLDTPPVEPVKKEEVEEELVVEEVVEEVPEKVEEKETPAEKILTQESAEAIKIKQANKAKKRAEDAAKAEQKGKEDAIKREKAKAAKLAQQKRDAEEKARREQEAKKKELDELMGGLNKSDGTASGSEGDDNRSGDKGQPDGDPYATSYYGSPGSGSGTGGYGLNGRSLVRKGKVAQECNEAGRVVVKIVVDRNGNVISATPGVKGTTNNSPCLLDPAKKTAFKHKWNLDSNAPSSQVGFVVVNFKLGG